MQTHLCPCLSSFWHGLGCSGVSRCSWEWDSPELPPGAGWDVSCSWNLGFPCFKGPSHPQGPAFPSEKNLPANRARKGEQQELFPPSSLLDSFGTTSTARLSIRNSQMSPFKKLKTFSEGSYITDQQLQNFCIKKINVAQFSCVIALDRNPRNHISEYEGSWLCGVSVIKLRLKPKGTECFCFLWGWFGISSDKWRILEQRIIPGPEHDQGLCV